MCGPYRNTEEVTSQEQTVVTSNTDLTPNTPVTTPETPVTETPSTPVEEGTFIIDATEGTTDPCVEMEEVQ